MDEALEFTIGDEELQLLEGVSDEEEEFNEKQESKEKNVPELEDLESNYESKISAEDGHQNGCHSQAFKLNIQLVSTKDTDCEKNEADNTSHDNSNAEVNGSDTNTPSENTKDTPTKKLIHITFNKLPNKSNEINNTTETISENSSVNNQILSEKYSVNNGQDSNDDKCTTKKRLSDDVCPPGEELYESIDDLAKSTSDSEPEPKKQRKYTPITFDGTYGKSLEEKAIDCPPGEEDSFKESTVATGKPISTLDSNSNSAPKALAAPSYNTTQGLQTSINYGTAAQPIMAAPSWQQQMQSAHTMNYMNAYNMNAYYTSPPVTQTQMSVPPPAYTNYSATPTAYHPLMPTLPYGYNVPSYSAVVTTTTANSSNVVTSGTAVLTVPNKPNNKFVNIVNMPSAVSGQFTKILKSCFSISELQYTASSVGTQYLSVGVLFKTVEEAGRAFRVLYALSISKTRLTVEYLGETEQLTPPKEGEKSLDIKCMVNLTKLLEDGKVQFSWHTSTPVSAPAVANIAPPPKRTENKSLPARANLISIRIGAAAAKAATSSPPVLDSKPENNMPIVKEEMKPALRDISIDKKLLKDSKLILENIKLLNKKQTVAKEALKTQMESLYDDCDESKDVAESPINIEDYYTLRIENEMFYPFSEDFIKVLAEHTGPINRINNSKVYYLRLESETTASLVQKLLPEIRFLDGYVNIESIGKPIPDLFHSSSKIKRMNGKLLDASSRQDAYISGLLKTENKKSFNILTYKIEPCNNRQCKKPSCNMFHNFRDTRRDPIKFKYRPVLCPYSQRCINGVHCLMAHNYLEIDYHLSVYPRSICDNQCTGPCPKGHIGTPSLLYSSGWKDLYVKGLHNTFVFFIGAVHMLYKVKGLSDVPIMLITPHEHVAKAAYKAVSYVKSSIAELKSCVILTGNENPKGCHIIIGELSALLVLLRNKGCSPLARLKALIIDDMPRIVNELQSMEKLVSLLLLLQKVLQEPKSLNKVVTGASVLKKYVTIASEILSTELIVTDGKKEGLVQKSPNAEDLVNSVMKAEFGKGNSLIEPRTSTNESAFARLAPKISPQFDTLENVTSDCETGSHNTSVSSSSSSFKPIPAHLSVPPPSLIPTFNASTHNNHSHSLQTKPSLFSSQNTNVGNNRRTLDSDSSSSDQRKTISSSNVFGEDDDDDENLQEYQKKLKATLSTSSQATSSQKYSPQQFIKEKNELLKTLEEEYSVYCDFPDMHPDYESMIEEFTRIFYRDPDGEEDLVWVNFYKCELKRRKEAEWEEKKAELIAKYKSAASSGSSKQRKTDSSSLDSCLNEISNSSTSSYVRDSTELPSAKKFASAGVAGCFVEPQPHLLQERADFDEAFQLLLELSSKIGIIGVSLRELIKDACAAGSCTPHALLLFANKNNAAILNLSIERLNELLATSSLSMEVLIKKGIVLLHTILHLAKGKPPNPAMKSWITPQSDLSEIARKTLGKSPNEIITIIKDSVEQHNRDNIAMINSIFLKISALHFQLAMPASNSQSSSSTSSNSTPAQHYISSSSTAAPTTTSNTSDSCWFVSRVKEIVARPNLSRQFFNAELDAVFKKKPSSYDFSRLDMKLACELQKLATVKMSDTMYLFTLHKIMEGL